jgi:hypothetical protein
MNIVHYCVLGFHLNCCFFSLIYPFFSPFFSYFFVILSFIVTHGLWHSFLFHVPTRNNYLFSYLYFYIILLHIFLFVIVAHLLVWHCCSCFNLSTSLTLLFILLFIDATCPLAWCYYSSSWLKLLFIFLFDVVLHPPTQRDYSSLCLTLLLIWVHLPTHALFVLQIPLWFLPFSLPLFFIFLFITFAFSN